MRIFWEAFALVFWAEMGDKTQLLAAAYAGKYRSRDVALGMLIAIGMMFAVSVSMGKALGYIVPEGYLQATAALCFIGFGIWTLFEEEAEEQALERHGIHPVWIVMLGFIIGELGDKTFFTGIALAVGRSWFPVWTGSVLGMFASDGLALVIGRQLRGRIRRSTFKWISAIVFFLFGILTGIQAWHTFHS